MAGGISEALITTQTGLIIAIPAYVMINRIVSQRDQLEIFHHPRKPDYAKLQRNFGN
ncbi:MAG: hypothetical protein CM15mP130_1350 [Verrucomicrobiota bacterium]|nr:MAG: hypothetical protein CM15mP130_1350 [Verrucomicrobiota bacterium]